VRRKMGLCYYCAHLGENNEDDEMACAAYPQGIPSLIVDGKRDHRSPLPGDNGILFEPDADVDPAHLEDVFSRIG
jgi:hypothetical protein